MAADRMVGKLGRVTGRIPPGGLGEVMIAVRGASEAFLAYAADAGETYARGTRIVVVEYLPPRTHPLFLMRRSGGWADEEKGVTVIVTPA